MIAGKSWFKKQLMLKQKPASSPLFLFGIWISIAYKVTDLLKLLWLSSRLLLFEILEIILPRRLDLKPCQLRTFKMSPSKRLQPSISSYTLYSLTLCALKKPTSLTKDFEEKKMSNIGKIRSGVKA